MSEYRHPAIRQLMDQQVRYAPVEKRQRQLDNLEKLLTEIEPGRKFPYQYVCYRITEYRSDSYPQLLIDGVDLEHDLRLFVRDLAATVPPVPAETLPEPVWTIDELSSRLNVSSRTINRWRELGLVTRWITHDGRRKVGVRQSLLNRFLDDHREMVDQSSRFSLLTPHEKDRIVNRAQRMARVAPDRQMDICRRLAKKTGRSVETIRYTLKRHEQETGRRIFAPPKDQLTDQDKQAIYNSYRRGIAVEALAKRFHRTRTSMLRIINEIRAKQLLAKEIDYIPHEAFGDPANEAEFLAPMPGLEAYEASKAKARASVPSGLPPELAALYEVPLLTREQEAHLFRKMNYLKYKAAQLRATIDPGKARSTDLDELEALLKQAQQVKEQLIGANMRLVVSIGKRHVGPSDNFFELLSDGNLSLIKAVEKFDFSRGFKFSTYASWAIMKNFARSIPEEKTRRDRFMTGNEEVFDAAPDKRSDEIAILATAERAKQQVNRLLGQLDERERRIMQLRAGLNTDHGMTLEQVGKELGITKERVRQLEARSLMKLRSLARTETMEMS
jgi:RNA polymerase sigma factor (sigma-70 family)